MSAFQQAQESNRKCWSWNQNSPFCCQKLVTIVTFEGIQLWCLWSDLAVLGLVGKLTFTAFQRAQVQPNRTNLADDTPKNVIFSKFAKFCMGVLVQKTHISNFLKKIPRNWGQNFFWWYLRSLGTAWKWNQRGFSSKKSFFQLEPAVTLKIRVVVVNEKIILTYKVRVAVVEKCRLIL